MANVIVSERDRGLLRLLDYSPMTADQLLRASVGLPQPFTDLKYIRKRLNRLASYLHVYRWQTASVGATQYYKLNRAGYRLVFGDQATLPSRSYFQEISPSLQEHTRTLSDVVVRLLEAVQHERVELVRFYRENSVTLRIDGHELKPDCSFELAVGTRHFRFFLELDMATEVLSSPHDRETIDGKIRFYDRLLDAHLSKWKVEGRAYACPRFAVLFLTPSSVRRDHMLIRARELAIHSDRHTMFAQTIDGFLLADRCLREPVAINHHGHWRSLVELHPDAPLTRPSITLQNRPENARLLTAIG